MSRRSNLRNKWRGRHVEPLEQRWLLSAIPVTTYHYDNTRSGLDASETILTPAVVNSNNFGKLFVDSVDGKVDAQPLYMPGIAIPGKGTHNVLFVATENDSLYAFDADSNTGTNSTPLWKVSLLGSGEVPSDDRGCSQITPTIGITATPVIDSSTNTMYVTAMSKLVSGSTTTYIQRIHAINITTGADKLTPVVVQASIASSGPNSVNGVLAFIPANYAERAALTLVNGTIYTTWTSHCDENVYNGWIIGYSASTLQKTMVLNVTPNGTEGSFWGSGAGPSVDSSGNLFDLDANGTFDTTLNAQGFPSQGDFGGTFIKVSTAGSLAVSDYFAPSTIVHENATDEDLGSGGTIVLPDMTDSSGHLQHLAIGAGKDGNIYLVNRDNMGKYNPNSESNIYQEIDGALSGGEWATSAYFNGAVYFGPVGNHLERFTFTNARLNTTPASQSSTTFAYPGTTPSISANGTSNGIVWDAENGSTAVLHAYDATDVSKELYNSNQAGTRDQFGTGNKFITPLIDNGKVYVGTTNGVAVFGLLAPLPAGFSDADIGGPGKVGSAAYAPASATWTLAGGGGDIWNTSDQFNYASKSTSGNQTISARVASLTNTNSWAKAGVMLRNSSAANAMFADVVVTPGNGVAFQWRTTTGGSCGNVNITGIVAPEWVRLTRSGNSFTAYYSANGTTWTKIGASQTIAMGTGILAGLAVTAHNNSALAVATFTNVSLLPGTTQVALAGSFNRTGIVADGSTFSGGFDGDSTALSGNLLGASQTWNSQSFALGSVGANNVVNATGQTITLPVGTYSTLLLLAAGVNGNQPNQTFVVHYADGTSTTFTQSISDWFTPQNYAGESKAVTMSYRDLGNGTKQNHTLYVYGYSFALNTTKTISSITLPNNANVNVLALDLSV